MAVVPPARHLLRARDLADARYFEPLDVDGVRTVAVGAALWLVAMTAPMVLFYEAAILVARLFKR